MVPKGSPVNNPSVTSCSAVLSTARSNEQRVAAPGVERMQSLRKALSPHRDQVFEGAEELTRVRAASIDGDSESESESEEEAGSR